MFRGCSSLPASLRCHAGWHGAGRHLRLPLILPDVSHQPVVHNPFPQLSQVAVAPFFNQSDEPTVDGRKFALAYFAELQAVPGFEVVPLGVVEEAIIDDQVDLSRRRRSAPAGRHPRRRRRRRRLGHRLHAVLSAALRPARRMVRGEPWLPRNSARLRPAVGHAGGRIHSRAAGVRSRVRAGQSAARDANARRATRRQLDPPRTPPQSAEPAPFPAHSADAPAANRRRQKRHAANDVRKTPPATPRSRSASAKSDGDSGRVTQHCLRTSKLPKRSCRRATALRVRRAADAIGPGCCR